jgi:hypothetical protein
MDILARAAREGLSVDGLNLAFTIALAQSGGNNPVADQIQNAGDFETHAVVGQPDEIADGVQLTLNADGSYTIEVTPARFGEDPTVYYREPGTPPGVWKALETVEAAKVSRGTLFRIDNSPEIQLAGPPDDYDAHMSLIDPVQWGQDQPSQDPALLKAQFLDRLSQILRMENLTATPKAEMAREVFREMSARGLSASDEGFVSQVTGIVQDQLMGSQTERDTFLRTFLDGIFGFDADGPGSQPR